MASHRVVITHPIPDIGIDLLRKWYDVTVLPSEISRNREALLEAVADADAVIPLLFNRIDEPFLQAAKRLKIVANFAVGYDNVEIAAVKQHRVMVSNTPDVLTNATAEISFALLLSVMRRIGECERYTRAGLFKGWAPMAHRGDELAGKTIGIIGMGRIGENMAQKCRAFGMTVIYHNRRRLPPETEARLGATYHNLDDLLTRADAVSIHAPSTPETRHLFDAERFDKMKDGAYIVNTARGDVIHEAALVNALKSGKLRGAGLDVYEFEPEITGELREMENVMLLPHIGSASHEARDGMSETAARNVIAALEGERPPNLIPELAAIFDDLPASGRKRS